jgi:hypothetical protein
MTDPGKPRDGASFGHDCRGKNISDAGRGFQDLELGTQLCFLMEDRRVARATPPRWP